MIIYPILITVLFILQWCWQHHTRLLYRFQKIDRDHFASVFSSIPWDCIDYTGDMELSWSMWKDLFLSAFDSAIPKINWKSRKLKHWFSPATIDLIHRKRKLYQIMLRCPNDHNRAKYRCISNLVCAMTSSHSKKRALDFSGSSPSTKEFWHYVNSIKHHCSSLPPLHSEDVSYWQ